MARTRKAIQSLELYKYDVLIEDRGPRSEYFKISQFDGYFYGGRNAFLVAGAGVLRPGSNILVEILNKNGTTVYSVPVRKFVEGNSRLIQVEVYEDTPIGPGKIIILGSTDSFINGTPVPEEWRGKYNIRWIADVIISPRVENKTPIRFVGNPSVEVAEKFYAAPSSSIFSQSISVPVDIELTTKYYNVFPNGYVAKLTGPELNQRYFSEYVNGILTGSIQFNGSAGSETASIKIPIQRIYNTNIAESIGSLIYTDKNNLIPAGFISSSGTYTTYIPSIGNIGVTSSLTLQYNELLTEATGSPLSFASIRLADLATVSGEIYKGRFSYKSATSPSNYVILGDVNFNVSELLAVDSGSKIANIGSFKQVVIDDYWYAATMSIARTDARPTMPSYYFTSSLITTPLSVTQCCTELLDSVNATPEIVNGEYIHNGSYFIGTRTDSAVRLFPRSEYTLAFDALVTAASSSIRWTGDDTALEVYLVPTSGSLTKLLDVNPKGQLLGTIKPNDTFLKQNFGTVEFNFVPSIIESGEFDIRFIVYGAFWNIANVSLKPATEPFFSPDEVTLLIPNDFKFNDLLQFKVEYLDVNNNSIGIETTSLPTYFSGSPYLTIRNGVIAENGELRINNFPVYNSILENSVTGLTSGGLITINPNYSQAYDISAGQGRIINLQSNPLDPTYLFVTWSAFTGVTASAFTSSGSLASWPRTQIAISASGEIIEQQNTFDLQDYRDYIVLGRLAHVNSRTIQRTLSLPLTTYAKQYHWFDLAYSIGVINLNGNDYSAASTNRTIQKTSGQTYRIGSNYKFDPTNPDVTNDSAINPVTFAYRYRSATPGVFTEQPVTTEITGSFYDNGSGTLQTVNNNQWTVQRIFFFGATETTRIQYGQFVYNSITDAEAAAFIEQFVADPNLEQDASLRAYLLVRGGAANLSSLADAEFLSAKSGLAGASGGGGATTLEALSDVDSSNPDNGDILVYDASANEWKHIPRFPFSGSATFTGSLQVTGSVTASSYVIPVALEPSTITATSANGIVNFDALTNSVVYYTQDATSDWTLNVRGNNTTTLDSVMTNGETRTVIFLATNGATPYYQTGFTIDGSMVTPKWQGGVAPSYGTADAVDIYSFSIIKTSTATFSVFGSKVYFA
jgi:hypothetical protein